MKKQLFIHIGLHKTGTTAIQNALYRSYDALLEQGILYPRSALHGGHHGMLASHLQCANKISEKYAVHGVSYYRNCWSNVIEEAKKSPAKKIVLSAEGFSTVKNLQQLAEYCHAFDTKVILYLRRQDQFLQALYNQHIKNPSRRMTSDISEFLHWNMYRGDFKTLISNWVKCFGQENVLIRIYEKAQLPKGSVNDFMSLIGHSYVSSPLPKGTNPSLPLRYVETVRLLNREPLSPDEHKRLMKIFTSAGVSRDKPMTTHSLFSPQQCHGIMQRFSADNEEIARYYLHRQNGALFKEPLPNLEEPWCEGRPIPPEELITELLIPYMSKYRIKSLTSEHIIEELLVPYIKHTVPRTPVVKQQLSVTKRRGIK